MMKRLLILLLCCLVLSGCAAYGGHPETGAPAAAREGDASSSLPEQLYDPDNATEAETAGVLKAYPLHHMEPQGFLVNDNAMILMGQSDGYTLLHSLSGEELSVTGSLKLNTFLSPEDGYVQLFDDRLAYYDPMLLQIVILDFALQELGRMDVPAEVSGTPLLSPDGKTLYYCTRDAIRALEPETGISRVLKEISGQYQTATALHDGENYLQCTLWMEDGTENTLVLSTETGRLVWQQEGTAALSVRDGSYWCRFFSDGRETLVFGQNGSQPTTLIPADTGGNCRFLPRSKGLVSMKEGALDYYDLSGGRRTAVLNLPDSLSVESVADGGNGILWLMGEDALYRWDISRSLIKDPENYTGGYATGGTPDSSSREFCLEYALALGEQYGIEILLFEDILPCRNGEFRLEAENQPARVMRQLGALEKQLEILPGTILESLTAQYGTLKIRMAGRILPEESALLPEDPEGYLYWEDATACILLSGNQGDTSFLHQLFHLMDTAAFTRTGSFDLWEELNPMRFYYTYSYSDPVPDDFSAFMEPETRAFADRFSMTFPREERARLFEYAVTPGMEELFQSHTMQKKLTAICAGIRESFGSGDSFLWEQYLKTPLA